MVVQSFQKSPIKGLEKFFKYMIGVLIEKIEAVFIFYSSMIKRCISTLLTSLTDSYYEISNSYSNEKGCVMINLDPNIAFAPRHA